MTSPRPTEAKDSLECPCVHVFDTGILTVSRIREASSGTSPIYDKFLIAFTAGPSDELYTMTLNVGDVGKLCSGDVIIDSTMFSQVVRHCAAAATVTVTRDQVTISWELRFKAEPKFLNCTVRLVLDKIMKNTPARTVSSS